MKKTNYVKAVAFLIGASMSVTLLNGCNEKDKTETTEGIVETEGSSESSAETESTTETEVTESTPIEIPEGADLNEITRIFDENDGIMYSAVDIFIGTFHSSEMYLFDPSSEVNDRETYSNILANKTVTEYGEDELEYTEIYEYYDGKLINYYTSDKTECYEYSYTDDKLISYDSFSFGSEWTTKITYDDNDRIIKKEEKIKDAVFEIVYDDNGKILTHKISEKDGESFTLLTDYIYEGEHLVRVVEIFPENLTKTTEYTYDGDLLVKETDTDMEGNKNIYEISYENGLPVHQVTTHEEKGETLLNEFTWAYDENGNVIKYESNVVSVYRNIPHRDVWEYTYDESGLVTHFFFTRFNSTDSGEEEACKIEGDYEYEFGDYLVQKLTGTEILSDGTKKDFFVECAYDNDGMIQFIHSSQGYLNYEYEYKYDDDGRLLTCIEKRASDDSVLTITTYSYYS